MNRGLFSGYAVLHQEAAVPLTSSTRWGRIRIGLSDFFWHPLVYYPVSLFVSVLCGTLIARLALWIGGI